MTKSKPYIKIFLHLFVNTLNFTDISTGIFGRNMLNASIAAGSQGIFKQWYRKWQC